jgi:hypothetical protein
MVNADNTTKNVWNVPICEHKRVYLDKLCLKVVEGCLAWQGCMLKGLGQNMLRAGYELVSPNR